MQSPAAKKIAIVGTGLLGGSIGLALRRGGFAGRIVGIGRREATLQLACEHGCIDEGATDLAAGVDGAELVILATPVGAILQVLADLGPLLEATTVVTDVGSTKRSIVTTAERLLPHPERFVGSHPMAGGELTGPAAADPHLFAGKPAVVTPTGRTAAGPLARVEQLWAQLGMRLHRMSPDDHDLAVARISHIPHAAAVMLVALAEEDDLAIASTGFGGTTRVAAGDPELWGDIFLDNADAMQQVFARWRTLWDEFEQAVADRDRPSLVRLLKTVQQARTAWEAGHTGAEMRGKGGARAAKTPTGGEGREED